MDKSSEDIELLILTILDNPKNNIIYLDIPLIKDAFDLFNFFIHILISMILKTKQLNSVDIERVTDADILFIQNRMSYAGIDLKVNVSPNNTDIQRINFLKINNGDIVSDYILEIRATNVYHIQFFLKPKIDLKNTLCGISSYNV